MLYIVPTPIGNLDDISIRALDVLRSVDLVYAEDTRVTARLFNHFDIKCPLESFHSHNEHRKLASVIENLENGKSVALVSDAGTPGISDPGFMLVREAVAKGIELTCLPGPTSVIPALVMSGLPCDKFYFEGFLPHKKGKQTRLKYILELDVTVVFFESPHRIVKTFQQLVDLGGGQRPASVSREISKMYEEIIRGTVAEVLEELRRREQIKGECVICIAV